MGGGVGRRDDEADFHHRRCRKNRNFWLVRTIFVGGGTLIKILATLEHDKGYFLCSNVAIIRRSITRVIEYPPARIGELVMNRISVEGGAKS